MFEMLWNKVYYIFAVVSFLTFYWSNERNGEPHCIFYLFKSIYLFCSKTCKFNLLCTKQCTQYKILLISLFGVVNKFGYIFYCFALELSLIQSAQIITDWTSFYRTWQSAYRAMIFFVEIEIVPQVSHISKRAMC